MILVHWLQIWNLVVIGKWISINNIHKIRMNKILVFIDWYSSFQSRRPHSSIKLILQHLFINLIFS